MIATLQEVDVEDGDSINHHKDIDNFDKTFRNDATKCHAIFVELGNPFEETEGGLVNKHTMDSAENESVRVAYESGKTQYENFLSDRLHRRSKSLYLPTTSNMFVPFRKKNW